jgi:hypothetical protein
VVAINGVIRCTRRAQNRPHVRMSRRYALSGSGEIYGFVHQHLVCSYLFGCLLLYYCMRSQSLLGENGNWSPSAVVLVV